MSKVTVDNILTFVECPMKLVWKSSAVPDLEDRFNKSMQYTFDYYFRQCMSRVKTYNKDLRRFFNTSYNSDEKIYNDKGFVHSFLSQTVAATGRLSSQDPNLQNIPTRSEMGKRVRAAFIPREKNGYILSADYSQIELRILAHVANVKKLIEAYASNRDIHTATASEIFNVPYEKVDSTLRSHAKAINFGIIYGMGPLALSKQTGVTMTQAKEFIAKYFERYPEIKKYMDDTKAFAHKNLYVETFLGRKRFLKDINSKNPMMAANAERQAINAPIQGAAADLVKMAMLAIHDMLEKNKFKSKMILQVHDELLFDVRADELAKLEPMVKHAMENVLKLKVPMLVECHHGKNWLEASK